MEKIQVADRKKINRYLYLLGFNKWYNSIPLSFISKKLREFNLILLQEDNTAWEGFLCGENSHTTISIGFISSKQQDFYNRAKTHLFLSWYKMPSGRYEIVSYIS